MKIFYDNELKNEVEDKTIKLGELFAGNVKDYNLYVVNDSGVLIKDLKFSIDNIEVEIIEAPEKMLPNEKALLKIKWNSSVNLKKGLKGSHLSVEITEVWE